MATPKLESNGKTWGVMANYTDARGLKQRKYKGGFESEAKAKKWATNYIAEMEKTILVNQNLKVEDIIKKLLYEKEFIEKRAQSTMRFYEQNFDIICDYFGSCYPRKINALLLQEFINNYIDTPRKCKALYQCLSILFNYMERLDLIDKNPYKKVKCPEYRAKETKYYDLETYKILLLCLMEKDSCIYTPVLLMGVLGLRPSEALALTEDDLIDHVLYVNKAAVTVKRKNKKQATYVGNTKTEKSNREFPLDIEFVERIHSYKKRHNIVSPYLCVQADGLALTHTILKNHLQNIIKEYSLPTITPYGLRHTFGQIQKGLGTDIYTISRIMGHSSIAITTKTYFHNDDSLNQTAINRLTGLI